ncbi:MAG: HAMP domain-containing sensor histidine kinase [Candidatus Nitrosopolaris sp.]
MTNAVTDANNDSNNERIEVLRNKEIIVSTHLQALHNANKWDYFAETKSLLLVPLAIESLEEALIDAKSRGIKLRFITEITKDNISRCKDTMKIAEVRHLDGVQGNFAVSDTEYIATNTVTGVESHSITIPYAIYSNVKEDIKQQHYVFEILWNKAIPAEQKIREIEEGAVIERTDVLYGTDNVISAELRFFSEAKTRINTCMDYTRPSLAIGIEAIRKSFVEAKSNGVQLRYLTEITNDNLSYCKEIMGIVDELRHLDSIKGNFLISESEYLAPITHDKIKPADVIIFSNVKEIVEHQQYVFHTFWDKAIPAEQKIREIEEGIVHYDTRIIKDSQEIIKEIDRLIASSNELYSCLTTGGIEYNYSYFFETKKKLLDRQKKGEHKGIKAITIIDESNRKLAKILLDVGIQIRHVRNLPPISFTLSDKEIAVTIEKMEAGGVVQSLLLSNESSYVSHFLSIFEELWKNGINAVERIKDIEAGADLADIEVIQSSSRAKELYLNLVKSAAKEVLLVFATYDAFVRQQKIGVIQLCQEAAKERNVSVRILMPAHESTAQTVQDLKQNYSEHIDVRYIEQTAGTKATILLVDRKVSLVMELRDDSKGTFDEAIGLSTYSNSRPGVLSYVSIFENLWTQTELYKQVKDANERLKLHDKMQQEFINVAAHELRTPIQPILTMVGILHSTKGHINSQRMDDSLEMIRRNAQRLKRLAEDILDVTKIETQSLILNKERLNLNDVVVSAIKDIKNQIQDNNSRSGAQILYESKTDDIIFIEADRYRVVQLVTNLLSNALKFVKGYDGLISINIEKKKDDDNGGQEVALVSVKDNGTGIDADISTRLFEKFVSKSFKGTGLGLFICRSIVEAHGGRIWAEDNRVIVGKKEATFHFTLPTLRR